MIVRRLLVGVAIATLLLPMTAADALYTAHGLHDDLRCTGTPTAISFSANSSCEDGDCGRVANGNASLYVSANCGIADRFSYAEEVYGRFNYIAVEEYRDAGCGDLKTTTVLPSTGTCVMSSAYVGRSIIAAIFANGSTLIVMFEDGNCGGEPDLNLRLDRGNISRSDCLQDYFKIYTSATGSSTSSAGSSSDVNAVSSASANQSSYDSIAIICIVLAAIALGVLIAFFVRNRRSSRSRVISDVSECSADYMAPHNEPKSYAISTSTDSSFAINRREQRSISYFWDDDEIATVRVDRDKVVLGRVISNGGFGQVFAGRYKGKRVAVKMLLPENRKSVKHLNAFLQEVKLMARLDHERIVKFVGVAWDSLADLCVLTELMEGGDLRRLLDNYEAQHFPVGFNETKVTIALHVTHALTYLHSLDPPVLHRDLKSRNILLNANLDARVTDFGIAREQEEDTMTAGVGTSRWMAPEVMMGERYDEKADVFSLGVVLSELDLHCLPYSHAVEDNNPSRKLPSTMIAHLVASGKLQVAFSSAASASIVRLGMSCVAVDPAARPTAAKVLYKLHIILTREFSRCSSDVSVGHL